MDSLEILDKSNSLFAKCIGESINGHTIYTFRPYTYLKALTVDNDHARTFYPDFFQRYGIETVPAESDDEAIEILGRIIQYGEPLDAITTDIVHPQFGGIEFIKRIRGLPDDLVLSGGLRVRHLPIVVITCCNSGESIEKIKSIDRNIQVVGKIGHFDEIAKAIDDAVCDYRTLVLDETHRLGLAIVLEGGRFSVLSCYLQTSETLQEGKYFSAPISELSEAYCRLVLVSERLTVAERSVAELEQLLNAKHLNERAFQDFFSRHPEFLYRNTYSVHWAEPILQSGEETLKPDFVLKPKVLPENPWDWEVLDLKRPDAVLATSNPRHPDLSAAVYHGCAQLRHYFNFFSDPRNHDRLKKQFGGIVPKPKLSLVIGRLSSQNIDAIGGLKRSVPDVQILTYDEVLQFRRADVEMQRWRHKS